MFYWNLKKRMERLCAKDGDGDDFSDSFDDLDEFAGGGADDSTEIAEDSEEDLEDLEEDVENESGDPAGDSSDDSDDHDAGDEPSELELLRAQNEKLMALFEKTLEKPEEKEEVPEVNVSEVFETKSFKTLTKVLDLDETESGVLQHFMEDFLSVAVEKAMADTIKVTPQIVDKQVRSANSVRDYKRNFYKKHTALEDVKEYVGLIANQVAKENPGNDIPSILEMAAARAYKNLGIKPGKRGKAGEKKQRRKPGFAKSGGSSAKKGKGKKKMTKADKIADILDL